MLPFCGPCVMPWLCFPGTNVSLLGIVCKMSSPSRAWCTHWRPLLGPGDLDPHWKPAPSLRWACCVALRPPSVALRPPSAHPSVAAFFPAHFLFLNQGVLLHTAVAFFWFSFKEQVGAYCLAESFQMCTRVALRTAPPLGGSAYKLWRASWRSAGVCVLELLNLDKQIGTGNVLRL